MPDDTIYDPSETEETPSVETETEDEGSTALLPKSLFPGDPKAGDTVTLTVVHVYEDEVEVGKAKEAEEPEESEEDMTGEQKLMRLGMEG